MLQQMIERVYGRVTGTPYYTTRVASEEHGPCQAAIHKARLARLGDDEAHAVWETLKWADATLRRADVTSEERGEVHAVLTAFARSGALPADWAIKRVIPATPDAGRRKVGAAR